MSTEMYIIQKQRDRETIICLLSPDIMLSSAMSGDKRSYVLLSLDHMTGRLIKCNTQVDSAFLLQIVV